MKSPKNLTKLNVRLYQSNGTKRKRCHTPDIIKIIYQRNRWVKPSIIAWLFTKLVWQLFIVPLLTTTTTQTTARDKYNGNERFLNACNNDAPSQKLKTDNNFNCSRASKLKIIASFVYLVRIKKKRKKKQTEILQISKINKGWCLNKVSIYSYFSHFFH